MNLRSMTPLLNVESAKRAIGFYTGTLGFAVEARFPPDGPPVWAMLTRGALKLMLNQPDDANSAERRARPSFADALLYFDTDDIDAVRAALVAAGAAPGPIVEQMYGRELRLRDPDGYELAVVQPPAPG